MHQSGTKVKRGSIVASVAVLALVGGIGVWARGVPAEVPLRIEPAPLAKLEPANAPAPSGSRRSMVHITGAVHRPGVYELEAGSRINDALRLAGGPTADAASDRLNLAAPVIDGQKIVVPSRDALAQATDPDLASDPAPATTEAPAELTPAPISGVISGTVAPSIPPATPRPRRATPSSPRRRAAKAPKPTLAPASIALNSANADDLDRLPGVGPATAQKILDERHRRGGFRSIEELLDVKGIGPAKLAKMRPYLTL